ncbi:hypothetical protein EDC96DRAFT_528128 [Choanephora cucurbitarum]|nr:hypothetical protein EDC96DRAFT_528128 [Choanephora cucurbitarum]
MIILFPLHFSFSLLLVSKIMFLILALSFIYIQCIIAVNPCSGTLKIKSPQDLDELRLCQVFEGSIYVQNVSLGEQISLPLLQRVSGNLILEDLSDPNQIILAGLRKVDGQLKLHNNLALKRLDLTQLASAHSLEITSEPVLEAITFPSGLSQLDRLIISDTMISQMDGITANKMQEIEIINNKKLEKITLNNIEEINAIKIASNGPLASLDLSGMNYIASGEFKNLHTVTGFDNIGYSGNIAFISNSFSTLVMSNLTRLTGTLSLSDNHLLTSLSVPLLEQIGGALAMYNNNQLHQVEAPRLHTVEGAVDLSGNFTDISFPSVMDIRGGMNVQSSQEMPCDEINKLRTITQGSDFIFLLIN